MRSKATVRNRGPLVTADKVVVRQRWKGNIEFGKREFDRCLNLR